MCDQSPSAARVSALAIALAASLWSTQAATAEECLSEYGRLESVRVDAVSVAGSLTAIVQRADWGERPRLRVFALGPNGLADLGAWEPRLYATDVALRGSIAIVAADGGLAAVDLRNPSQPVERSWIDLVDSQWLAVDGDFAYVVTTGTGGNGWFDVVDISNPTAIEERGSLYWDRPDPWKSAIDATDGVAAIADSEGVLVIDVSDPWLPRQAGRWSREGVLDVVLAGHVAAVAIASFADPDDAGVAAVELSDPDHPTAAGWWHAPSAVRAVARFGDKIAAGTDLDGIFVLDIDSATSPTVTEHWDANGVIIRDLAGAWPGLVAGHNEQGVTVIGLDRACLPPRRPSARLTP